jgi:hypothetical protein
MARDYVDKVGGVYRVAGSRQSLVSIVWVLQVTNLSRSIASFPALTLEQIYGAIAFLANRRPWTNICGKGAPVPKLQASPPPQRRLDHPVAAPRHEEVGFRLTPTWMLGLFRA